MYNVIDIHTKAILKTYDSRVKARHFADKLDLKYGAVRYVVVAV